MGDEHSPFNFNNPKPIIRKREYAFVGIISFVLLTIVTLALT